MIWPMAMLLPAIAEEMVMPHVFSVLGLVTGSSASRTWLEPKDHRRPFLYPGKLHPSWHDPCALFEGPIE